MSAGPVDIRMRESGRGLIPYLPVSLKRAEQSSPPRDDDPNHGIRRIVIGPGFDKKQQTQALKVLLQSQQLHVDRIDIVPSEVPYTAAR